MINWTAVEDAVMAWAKTAGGFADGRAFWAAQGGPRPAGPFLELMLDGPIHVGQDEVRHKYDAAAAAGQEIVTTAKGLRQVVARVQVFDGDVTDGMSSRALVSQMVTALSLPGVRAALNTAGLGLASIGKVTSLPDLRAASFSARAAVDVTFQLFDSVQERTGYIASATLKQINPDTLATVRQTVVP